MLGHGKKCFGLRQGSEIDPSSWPYTCFCLMDMLASHQALSFRLFSSSFFQFWGFQFFLNFFGIYTEQRKFPKISDIFKWPQCENLPQKNATQLTRLPKAQCSHMYSSLSEEWLQANQVEHIGCLTQIWSIASNFFQTTHTFLPSLPEPQNTIPQLQVEVWSID